MSNVVFRKIIFVTLLSVCLLSAPILVAADDEKGSNGTTDLFIKFKAIGTAIGFDSQTGESSYRLIAEGFQPEMMDNGEVKNKTADETPIARINDAVISFEYFDFNAPSATVKFSCQNCNLSFEDGSVLESDTLIPLDGRALFAYGPVPTGNTAGIATIRMMGCAGLREAAGLGKYANMVGSICFNGVFDFDMSNPPQSLARITGASNCTITLHKPSAVSMPTPL